MLVGALVDAGVPIKHIEKELSKIPLKGYNVQKKSVQRRGIKAIKVNVIEQKTKKTRKWENVKKIIESSRIDGDIKAKGLELFKDLFDVEAKVHGKRAENVHLHELGAVDCIVDIFSVLIGLKYLDIQQVYSSPINLGSGLVETQHGQLPVPAPATLALLVGAEVYSTDTRIELTTPTGALLISRLADGFGEIPSMKVLAHGYGAGSRDIKKMPNVLRIIIGDDGSKELYEDVYVIETNIDDMNPQFYEHVMERLFRVGALDVFLTTVIMKKQRPGVKLTVLVKKDVLDKAIHTVLDETTTIGVRFARWGRTVLQRESVKIKTEFGNVGFKKVFNGRGFVRVYPEYDDCRNIANKNGLPITEVFETLKNYAKNKEKK
jgi:hypothetical protein